MPRRGHEGGAAVLSLQVQRKHKVRPPGLLDGMAIALAKEALRTVQDALPLHQALSSTDAEHPPNRRLPSQGRRPRSQTSDDMVPWFAGRLGVAVVATLVHEGHLARSILVR